MLKILTKAKTFGRFMALSLANGIEQIASKAMMSANQITYSLLLGYRILFAMGFARNIAARIKMVEVIIRESKVVL